MNLQRLIDEARQFSFLVGQYCREGNVAFEVANLDDHLIALFGHQYLVHFDMRQGQAQDIGVALAKDLLNGAAMENLRGIEVAKDGMR